MSPVETFRASLSSLGRDPTRLTTRDQDFLASVDEFHCLGRKATDELCALADIGAGARVLDFGCGLGGPARRLATHFGCDVVGIDITQPFLDIATGLTERMGLSNRVTFQRNDATEFSSKDGLFDFVWMQVTASNVANRHALYRAASRSLKPNGRFAIFDIFDADRGAQMRFPVPWAENLSTHTILTIDETLRLAWLNGFELSAFDDVTSRAINWFEDQLLLDCSQQKNSDSLRFSLFLPEWRTMCRNQIFNLKNRAIRFAYVVFTKI